MNSIKRPLILFDPYPRSIGQIFDAATKARLEALGEVIWHHRSKKDNISSISSTGAKTTRKSK